MKEQTSISIKYIDTKLFEDLEKIAKEKNYVPKSKGDLIKYVLKDYVYMNEFNDLENPYMLKAIMNSIEAACSQTEKNLGGRMTKLIAEEAINLGILNRIVLDFLNKFNADQETEALLHLYRQKSVEDLRASDKPISYLQLIKEEDDV